MILLNIAWFVIINNNSPIPKSPLTPPPLLRYDPADNIFGSSMTNKTTTHPKVQLNLGSNPWPPDHDSTFHVQ